MLHKTRGIVFKYFKYRDSSIIAKIFTEEFGLQTYIVNGVRSSKAKGKIAFYQPLTLLEMVVYKKPNADINRISEIRCSHPLKSIPFEITKSSIGVFLSEVLYKVIKEDESVTALFDFVYHSIEVLDSLESDYHNFHLQFLIKLSHHLGFGISGGKQFPHLMDDQVVSDVNALILATYTDPVKITGAKRREILDNILSFYKAQVDSLHDIKSVGVLKTVLKEG